MNKPMQTPKLRAISNKHGNIQNLQLYLFGGSLYTSSTKCFKRASHAHSAQNHKTMLWHSAQEMKYNQTMFLELGA